MEDKPPPSVCEVENSKEKNLMQRDAHSSDFCTLSQNDEDEMPMYAILSDLCNDHISLQLSYIPYTSHHGGYFAEDSKADLYVENEFYVVDPCHKKNGLISQLLEEGSLVEDISCETHHLIKSLKEDRESIMASMNNFVDINALVARCCWKASRGEMEGESFLE